ncbi:MAG: hypothetical protein U9O97_01530 [Elusimicrobiota bacterium]|nr:hypothetical protein [Elusimicrobiota bacterium]
MTAGNFYSLMFRPRVSWEVNDCRYSLPASVVFFTLCRFAQFAAFGFAAADFVLFVPVLFFEWITTAAILHFFAHSAGGRGSVTDFFHLLPFAEVPFLFLPGAKILSGTFFSSFGGAFAVMAVMVYVWSFVLKIKAVMFNYRISAPSAFAVFAAPVFIVFVLTAAALFLRASAMFL